MGWLQAIAAFFQLLDTILRKHLQKKRELEEQEIKENPREFFEQGNRAKLEDRAFGAKGNRSSTDQPESNSLSVNSKEY